MKNKPNIGISDDYATAQMGDYSFYYGYETENEEGEWCFEASIKGEKITIPGSKIGLDMSGEMAENVLIGIMWLFAKYDLKLKPKFQTNKQWLEDYDGRQ